MSDNPLLEQLRRRQRRYEDTGDADTGRDAFLAAGKRDAAALLLGSAPCVHYLCLALGEPQAASRLRLLDSILDPLSPCSPN